MAFFTAQRVTYDAQVAARYDANYSDSTCQAENRELAKLLDALLIEFWMQTSDPFILDVGCGTGLVPDLLGESESHRDWWAPGYVGLDLSDAMLNVAQRKHEDLHFVHGSMDDLSFYFNPTSFDVIVSTFALLHTRTPGIVLEEMYRLLRPGGRILVVAHGHHFRTDKRKLKNHIVEGREEITTLSADDLDMLALAAGFTRISVTGFSYGSQFVGLERKLLGKRWPDRANYLVLQAYKHPRVV